jgi:cytosine/adenosine deaminase-related metal-dependent hydrolase
VSGAAGVTVVHGEWVLAWEDGQPRLLTDASVVVEGATIAAVIPGDAGPADRRLGGRGTLVLPGFLNLHTHALNARVFRGLVDDVAFAEGAGTAINRLLMPVAGLVARELGRDELAALATLGLLDLLQSGCTTVADMFRPELTVLVEAARALGVRLWAFPYLVSPASGPEDVDAALARSAALIREFDEGPGGRLRVGLGPHGTDTCSAELLRAVRKAADALDCPVSLHLAQSPTEVEAAHRRYGKGPVAHADEVGLLGPGVLAAHCLYATETELALLRERGAAVVSCPLVYARWGISAPYHRFASRGVLTALGTDQERDYVEGLRLAGLVSRLEHGQSDAATAWELVEAATVNGARALRRPDLGRIAPGARADLAVVDLGRPHLAPVFDPIKSLVWHAHGDDVRDVLVDGEVLVLDGHATRVDEAAVRRQAAAAIEHVWRLARERGFA